MDEKIFIKLDIPIEDAVLISGILEKYSMDEHNQFDDRDEAFRIYQYINKRVLQETGEI